MLRASRTLAAASLCYLAVASPIETTDFDDDMALLQLKMNTESNASVATSTTATNYGCRSRGSAQTKWVCGEWGDPHNFRSWGGNKDDNPSQDGWHWLVKSKDDEMKVQVFLSRDGNRPPVVSAMAGKFGKDVWKILRKGNKVSDFKLIVNDELQADKPTKEFKSGFYVKPRAQNIGGHGGSANVAVCMDSADARFTTRMDAVRWVGDVPGGIYINMEVVTDKQYVDEAFPSFCTRTQANQPYLVADKDIIVSNAENKELCKWEGLTDDECQNPPIHPPLPPNEQACKDNNIDFEAAKKVCEGVRTRGLFDGCVEDCCNGADLQACVAGARDMLSLVDEELTFNACKFGRSCGSLKVLCHDGVEWNLEAAMVEKNGEAKVDCSDGGAWVIQAAPSFTTTTTLCNGVLYDERPDGAIGEGWSSTAVGQGTNEHTAIAKMHGPWGNELKEVTRSWDVLGGNKCTVSWTSYGMHSRDAEWDRVYVNGDKIWEKQMRGGNKENPSWTGDCDKGDGKFNLKFTSMIDEAAGNERWGFNNVKVEQTGCDVVKPPGPVIAPAR